MNITNLDLGFLEEDAFDYTTELLKQHKYSEKEALSADFSLKIVNACLTDCFNKQITIEDFNHPQQAKILEAVDSGAIEAVLSF